MYFLLTTPYYGGLYNDICEVRNSVIFQQKISCFDSDKRYISKL